MTLAALPKPVAGFDQRLLVIDDCRRTAPRDVARERRAPRRALPTTGLARAFSAGLDARSGWARRIVNTDADNQYCADDIRRIGAPILDGSAGMVVGDRQGGREGRFGTGKRVLQRFGSFVVRLASDTTIPDTTSGFRAIAREAALRLFVVNDFTYTLETIIQAGQADWAVTHVPIRTNRQTRKSRLFRSVPEYLRRSAGTILRIYTMYRPLRAFVLAASICFLAGLGLLGRFLYFYLEDPERSGHVQSLIVAAVLLVLSFQLALPGVVADLIAGNRKMLADVLYRVRKMEAEAPRRSAASLPDQKPPMNTDGHR